MTTYATHKWIDTWMNQSAVKAVIGVALRAAIEVNQMFAPQGDSPTVVTALLWISCGIMCIGMVGESTGHIVA